MSTPAFIWDLDGTLIDSYEAIMEALEVVYAKYDLPFEPVAIRDFILAESVGALLDRVSSQYGLEAMSLKADFTAQQEKRDHLISLLPHARQALLWTQSKGIKNFMYTHKGQTTNQVLADLGIDGFFTEVLTAVSGFKRKPDPEAIDYLVDKYGLDREETYYIGDRKLDLEVAIRAGIKSINLTQSQSPINQPIKDLSEIRGLF